MDTGTTELRQTAASYGADGLPLHPERSEADREIFRWQNESPYYVPPPAEDKHRHIVDVLIKERAPKLSRSRFWPIYRVLLNKLLGYRKAKRMVDEAGRLPADEAFAYASGMLDMNLDVTGLEHIPKEGGFIIALNHPTGIADGLAVHDAIADIRPDGIVFVNGDAIRLNPRLTDKLIPVEWRPEKKNRAKSRETLVASNQAFAEGRAIILFPSGRLAYMDEDKKLQERPWMSSVAALAKKYKVPVIPAHIRSRNSWLYYWFWKLNEELRDMTLFHELFNKRGKTFHITIRERISPSELLADNDEAAAELRDYVCQGVPAGQTFTSWRVQQAATQKPVAADQPAA
ncbi:lysophospholipid acyltransferase family protein [Parvularcula sp. LCG005]|uniref:lysophospholipid acyltransferase family protein n=1 Tax=Parvularcula sp. LCG005 TaxID=3078805 RepID=UPI002942CF95|nr:lysophospholipid acyltransferase family protein [Parvularcula sp. LCG005]WOI53365.1 lysophospholipid acyltransferase family protein [Parvularcula sp. LCG005]